MQPVCAKMTEFQMKYAKRMQEVPRKKEADKAQQLAEKTQQAVEPLRRQSSEMFWKRGAFLRRVTHWPRVGLSTNRISVVRDR